MNSTRRKTYGNNSKFSFPGSPTLHSELTYGRHTPLCVRIFKAYGTILLFIGWTSCEVQVMALENESFRELCKLFNHEDWVRGVDVRELEGEPVLRNTDRPQLMKIMNHSIRRVEVVSLWSETLSTHRRPPPCNLRSG